MRKIIYILLLLHSSIFALDIDSTDTHIKLLPYSEIYIDPNNNLTIENIKDKPFKPNNQTTIGYGYSPDFTVWIKFVLSNHSSKKIHKVIEYDNPLTSRVTFYENNTLLHKGGLSHLAKDEKSLHPAVNISLKAKESKTYHIKASSSVTTMIVKLNLWNNDYFYKKELRYQFILALFFGAMGIVILYNFIVFIMTQDKSYLYYVLFFVGITVHHLIYRGIAHLYILPPEVLSEIIKYSIFIVAFPAFFLALFMKEILNLKQHKSINIFLNRFLILFPLFVLLFHYLGYDNYRNFPTMILLLIVIIILIIMIVKRNRYAYYIATGWILFISSAVAMQLSSMGKYDIFTTYPYYSEFALIIEAILFSLILSNKIKQLHKENAQSKEKLIEQQKEEEIRLKKEVEEKTADLVKSLSEKKLLLKELNHRVKNNLQTILFFVRSQIHHTSNNHTQIILETLEHRIFAISHLHTLLHQKGTIDTIEAKNFFTLIVAYIQKSFSIPKIKIHIDTSALLHAKDAFYCGFILNEAMTNIYQHAFAVLEEGEIFITLSYTHGIYTFIIKDTGKGYDTHQESNSSGLYLIERLVSIQLEGSVAIDSSQKGTTIQILWEEEKDV